MAASSSTIRIFCISCPIGETIDSRTMAESFSRLCSHAVQGFPDPARQAFACKRFGQKVTPRVKNGITGEGLTSVARHVHDLGFAPILRQLLRQNTAVGPRHD